MQKTNDIRMVTIGHFKLSLAAFITLVAGMCVSLLLLILAPNIYGALSMIYILLVAILFAYGINCTLLGHCKVFAWVLTILYTLSAVSSSIYFGRAIFQGKFIKNKKEMHSLISSKKNDKL